MKNYINPEMKISMFEQVISTTEVAVEPSYVDAIANPEENTRIIRYNVDYAKVKETLNFQ